MKDILPRFAASCVLLLWGVLMSYFYLSGRVASYLHPAFHIYTIISGIVLLLLSISLLFTFPSRPSEHLSPRWFSNGGIFSLLLLTIPVLAATKLSPGSFGDTAVMNRGMVSNISDLPGFSPPREPGLPNPDGSLAEGTLMDPSLYLKKNDAGYIGAETVDLLYAAGDPVMREDFENKLVELSGQFLPALMGNPNGNRFNLTRLFVMCCAADARPIAITVQSNGSLDFPKMTWLKVRGTATFPVENGRHTPVIIAESVNETDPPEESFLY